MSQTDSPGGALRPRQGARGEYYPLATSVAVAKEVTSMQKDLQGRKWLLTVNNPTEKGLTHKAIQDGIKQFPSLLYWCMADEKGESEHTHVFFVLEHPTRFSTIKRRFPTAHIDRAEGTASECRDYVQKSGKWADSDKAETSIPSTFEEWGELPIERQGERTDLALLYQMIKDGMSNYEIMEANPDYLVSLDRIERARQAVREQQYRETFRRLEVIYIWGPTGVGKTRSVMEKYGYSSICRITDYDHPFESYTGEDVLLFDEYSSNFKIRDLLNYLDGYPLTLPARYSNRVACYTKVYIISNLCLFQQYTNEQYHSPTTFAALLRRINKVVRYTAVGKFDEYKTSDYMDNPFLWR